MDQTLYMVMGYQREDEDSHIYFPYLYGVFSTENKAKEIMDKLNNSRIKSDLETFEIVNVKLDSPTDIYYVSAL